MAQDTTMTYDTRDTNGTRQGIQMTQDTRDSNDTR